VSLVEVSPSTIAAFRVGATAARVARPRAAAGTAASVATKLSVVAMLGAIMPAPLVQPSRVTRLRPIVTVRWASLTPRSVVRIAAAKSPNPSGLSAAAAAPMPSWTLGIGSGWPITPVDATSTSRAVTPRAPAVDVAIARAAARPAGPVQALALPALTITARVLPRLARRCSAETKTGAALTRLPVNTAATVAGASAAISPTSLPPFFLMPAATPAKRNPGISGSVIAGTLPPPPRACRPLDRRLSRPRTLPRNAEAPADRREA
jgi:hypothetical protein